MLIGIPKEVKNNEYRVGATPSFIRALVEAGHQVIIQTHAGSQIQFSDEEYQKAGAKIVQTAADVYAAEMIIKVKEPQKEEFSLLREGQILFCYLHLAPDPIQTQHLLEKKVIGIAYDTVTDENKRLPLLTPMSEIAGRLAIQVGGTALQLNHGGPGILLGGVPGVRPAKVVVIGGGVSGTEAARMALGAGAEVTIIDRNLYRLRELDFLFQSKVETLFSTSANIESALQEADLVIGAVLIAGKRTPRLITKETIKKMKRGAVFVDISIDQGGCSETSRPTTHTDPIYVVDGVIHYCVTNMPGAVAKTATLALTNSTLSYALEIANKGWRKALQENPYLVDGLNVALGKVTNPTVANDLGYPYTPFSQVH